jgi:hypothetical protein
MSFLRAKSVGMVAVAVCLFCVGLSAAEVMLKKSADTIEVSIGAQPFTTFYFGDITAKPYLMPLRTASGVVVSRPFPVQNHVTPEEAKTKSFEPHQRPLYFGHGNINGLSFWIEKAFAQYYDPHLALPFGHTSLIGAEITGNDPNEGQIRAHFNLVDPGGRIIGEETQTFRFRGDDRTRTIDCEFVVLANHGPLTFGDTKEGAFAVRLGSELSAPNDHMLNSNGGQGEHAIWGKPADWVSYSGAVSGKPVSVAVFDGPKSFRHPTTWHARAYGLLAANPFGLREFTNDDAKDGSWTVPEGKSITFQYRVLLNDGVLTASQLDALYKEYAAARQ